MRSVESAVEEVGSDQPILSSPLGVEEESRPKMFTMRVIQRATSLTEWREGVVAMYLLVSLIRSVITFMASEVLKLSQRAVWRFVRAVSSLVCVRLVLGEGEGDVLFVDSVFQFSE